MITERNTHTQTLIENLQSFIALNPDYNAKEEQQLLGKITYTLADVYETFVQNMETAAIYYQKAADIMPNNHFYRYRYLMTIPEKTDQQDNEITSFEANMYNSLYDLWRETRWHENPTQSTEEMGIHNILAEDATITQTLSRLFFK